MSTDLKKMLEELKVYKEPEENENGSYTVDFDDSNEYHNCFYNLDKAEWLEPDDESSSLSDNNASMTYITLDDKFDFILMGDLEADTYKLIIRENGDVK